MLTLQLPCGKSKQSLAMYASVSPTERTHSHYTCRVLDPSWLGHSPFTTMLGSFERWGNGASERPVWPSLLVNGWERQAAVQVFLPTPRQPQAALPHSGRDSTAGSAAERASLWCRCWWSPQADPESPARVLLSSTLKTLQRIHKQMMLLSLKALPRPDAQSDCSVSCQPIGLPHTHANEIP